VIVPVAVLIWVGAADLLSGVIILVTVDLSAFGAAGRALRKLGEADRKVARGEARSAYTKGCGAAVALIAAGTAI
jgi:hypothetical protein